MTPVTYQIPDWRLTGLEARIAQLNRRCVRLGVAPINLRRGESRMVQLKDKSAVRLVEVTLTGEAPHLNGWRFLAVLQHLPDGNIIRGLPWRSDTVDLEKYRERGPWCEQCNTYRDRKDTYLVQHESGETKQVGSSCLADFTGSADPHNAAAAAEILASAHEALDEADSDPLEAEMSGGGNYFPLGRFLRYVCLSVRLRGWRSRSEEGIAMPTADHAFHLMQEKKGEGVPEPDRDDMALAEAALKWCREELAKGDLNNYEHNLTVACADNFITAREIGITASLIVAYNRHVEKKLLDERTANSDYVGQVGQRCRFEGLTVISVRQMTGLRFDSYLHRFVDPDGNILIWFSSKDQLKVGKVYAGVATVKEHKVYEGQKQTYLTRCQFETPPDPVTATDVERGLHFMLPGETSQILGLTVFRSYDGWAISGGPELAEAEAIQTILEQQI